MSSSVQSEKVFEAPEGNRPWYAHDGDWWLEIILVIIAGLFVEAYLEKKDYFLALRYQGYSWIQQGYSGIPRWIPRANTPPPRTAILLVDDAEYWKTAEGFPGGRSPISRTYLACLVATVAELKPDVIALDFDLRTGHRQEQVADAAHGEDTLELTDTINRVTMDPRHSTKVVLAKSLWKDSTGYLLGSDIYDGLVNRAQTDSGFIALPHQTWRMPYPLTARNVKDEKVALEPFSLAAAKSVPGLTATLKERRVPFAPYRDVSEWVGDQKDALVDYPGKNTDGNICRIGSAGCRTVLASFFSEHTNDPAVQALFAKSIVLIGGDWHTRAYGQGERADRYLTPAGEIPGVLIHAGYIEGFRTFMLGAPTRFREWAIRVGDFCLSLFFALLLASFDNYPRRVRLERFCISLAKIFTALLFLLVAFIASAVIARIGYFFDFTVVAIIVVAHYAYDSVEWPWRKEEMDRDCTLLALRWMKARLVAIAGSISTGKPQPTVRARAAASSSVQEHRATQVRSGEPSTDSADRELKTGTK